MKDQKQKSVFFVLVLLVIGAGWATSARGREGKPITAPDNTGMVAMVDLDRVYSLVGYQGDFSQKELELNAEEKKRFDALIATRPGMLDLSELQELLQVLGKVTPTEADKVRIEALKTLSAKRNEELELLHAKPQDGLTPTDRAIIDKGSLRQRTFEGQFLPTIQNELLSHVRTGLVAFREEQFGKIRVEISKMAREKGISQVFDRQLLIYCATDLTDEAVKRLTRKPR